MSSTGKILIVDDNEEFLRLYKSRLGEEGYDVDTATTEAAALAKLDAGGWDVVLVDQKLQGEGGPDTGLDLLAEVMRRAPAAKAILVTAFATPAAVRRAFQSGAYDYLQKDNLFTALLVAKLRNALEAVRAHHLGGMTPSTVEDAIRATWEAVTRETDANRKGAFLEDLMLLLFKSIPGFQHTSPRRSNDIEEIDLIIRNESPDPFWNKEKSQYILVECKNWSKPVGTPELRNFLFKIERRYGRCNLGFFIAPHGFTGTFEQALLAERRNDHLVVCIDGEDLRKLVMSTDRNTTLKELHDRAIVEANGH